MLRQQNNRKISWRIISLVIILQILAVSIGVRWYLAHTNVLANNQKWVVSKSQLFFPSHDSGSFAHFPPAVADNALNLAAWRGYHQVITREAFNWSDFDFHFQPNKDGYIYVIFDYNPDLFSAIRLSFNSLYRSELITAKYTGEFITQKNLPALPFSEQLWQQLKIKRNDTNKTEYELWINDVFVTRFETPTLNSRPDTKIGFRGGQWPVLVDTIKIHSHDGRLLFAENFDNQDDYFTLVVLITIGLLALHRIAFLLLNALPTLQKTYFQFLFVVSVCVILTASIGLLIEQPLRNRYPDFNHWWFRLFKGPVHSANTYLANKIEWVFNEHPPEKPLDTKRIIILGGSQVEGEGISRAQEDVSSQLEQLLNNNLHSDKRRWEVIAVGVSGHTAEDLVEPLKHQWLKLQPDLIIINLSSNDASYNNGEVPKKFMPSLSEFAQLSKEHHFTLVFSAEPNSIESVSTLKTHAAMRQVAEKERVQFLHTHDYINTKTDTGILWWDFVHMTSYGYRLMAEYFFRELEPVFHKL